MALSLLLKASGNQQPSSPGSEPQPLTQPFTEPFPQPQPDAPWHPNFSTLGREGRAVSGWWAPCRLEPVRLRR